ncbi:MAG: PDZ domain-containing protein [Acidimicrobiia bacterium]
MVDKKAVEAEAAARVARAATEKRRLIWAGVALAAVALFVGGYAIGNAAGDDDSFAGSDVVVDQRRPDRFPAGERGPEGHGHRFPHRHRFPGPGDFEFPEGFEFRFPEGFSRRFEFHFPEGFEFPGDFEFPEGFEFRFPEDFEFPEGFEFRFPEDFDFGDEDGDERGDDRFVEGAGFLGVEVFQSPNGVVVAEVLAGSPASEAGLEVGDIIVEVAGSPIESVADLVDVIGDAGPGTEVEVFILRGDRAVSFEVVLGARPN